MVFWFPQYYHDNKAAMRVVIHKNDMTDNKDVMKAFQYFVKNLQKIKEICK